jgi:4Fe-4S ferredoxin
MHSKTEISRRELLKMAAPMGKVELEKARCTGCGLCVLNCPTGALSDTADTENNTYRILFRHNHCAACNMCVEICPEHCLEMERALEISEFDQPAVVLFEDEAVKCTACGAAFAPQAMINSIKRSLSGKVNEQALELCPECKAKARFNLMGSGN